MCRTCFDADVLLQGVSHDGSKLPSFLAHKRVMSLDVGQLMAGAKERGELELRVTKILSECKESGTLHQFTNICGILDSSGHYVWHLSTPDTTLVPQAGDVVLMIDEVHTLVGAGAVGRGGGGGLDISNLLKPALAR